MPGTPLVDKDLKPRLDAHHLKRLPSEVGEKVVATGKCWDEMDAETQRQVLQLLRSLPLCDGTYGNVPLTSAQISKFAEQAVVEHVNQKDVLQVQGEMVNQIWMVLEGSLVKFHREGDADNVIEYVESGGQVGLLHVFGSDVASSTVLVDSPTAVVAMVDKTSFMEVLHADPALVMSLIVGLSRALRAQTRRSKNSRLVRYVDHLKASQADPSLSTTGVASDANIRFLSAALSALGSLTATFPLDTTRTRLQSEGRGDIVYGLQVLAHMVMHEGWAACFSGWSTSAVSHTVQNTAFHSAYDALTQWFQSPSYAGDRKPPVLSDLLKFALGLLSGFFSAFLVCPLHVLSFRLQGKDSHGKSLFRIIRQIVDEGGVLSLWHGIGPALVLALNPTITFYSFDVLKTLALRHKAKKAKEKAAKGGCLKSSFDRRTKTQVSLPEQQKLSPLETLCLAALAKSIASALTFPFLMAKIRMGLYGKKRYPDMMSTIAKVMREEGTDGLFKGMGISLLRSIIIAALEFLLREKLEEVLARMLRRRAIAAK